MKVSYQGVAINLLDHDESLSKEAWFQQIVATHKSWLNQDPIQLHTSGSTGPPKAITHSPESVRRSAELTIGAFRLTAQTEAWLCLPAQYIAGKMMIIRAMVADYHLHISRPSANPLADLHTPIDFAAMTPMQLELGLSSYPEKLSLINTLILGGGPVSALLESKIQDQNTQIYHTYGMTETITHIAIRPINGSGRRSYFTTLPGVQVGTTPDDRLIIHAEHLDNNPVETTDIVTLLSPTSFEWRGRADQVINSGGLKIHPEHVESLIGSITTISDFFITGKPDPLLGEKVVLVTDVPECYHAQLLIKINAIQDKKKRPKEIIFVKNILRTPTGKIIKNLDKYTNVITVKPC